jgi:hypothetical protein
MVVNIPGLFKFEATNGKKTYHRFVMILFIKSILEIIGTFGYLILHLFFWRVSYSK